MHKYVSTAHDLKSWQFEFLFWRTPPRSERRMRMRFTTCNVSNENMKPWGACVEIPRQFSLCSAFYFSQAPPLPPPRAKKQNIKKSNPKQTHNTTGEIHAPPTLTHAMFASVKRIWPSELIVLVMSRGKRTKVSQTMASQKRHTHTHRQTQKHTRTHRHTPDVCDISVLSCTDSWRSCAITLEMAGMFLGSVSQKQTCPQIRAAVFPEWPDMLCCLFQMKFGKFRRASPELREGGGAIEVV